MKAETLKKSILQYAMQGKLVEQNPDNEPASELLKRIKAEKEQLIKEGKIKKEKPLPPIAEDEIPYELPQGWEWIRLSEICNIIMGQSPDGNTVVTVGDGIEFHQGKVFFGNKYLKVSNQITTEPTKIAELNSILLCVRAPVGKINITDRNICIGRGLCGIKSFIEISTEFLYYLLLNYEDTFVKQATGTTFVAITGEVVKKQIIPLPPLAEQQRIVEKLEQILPLIEEYGKNEEKLSELNKTLSDKIKQSILQHAVQGKLVPQNPADEPASELLKRIKSEKEQLIKDGKIKKEKPLPLISDDEIPFKIPTCWSWCRLSQITSIIGDGIHGTPQYTLNTNFYFINGNNLKDGIIEIKDNTKTVSEDEYLKYKKELTGRTVLVSINGTLGNVAFYNNERVMLGKSACYFNLLSEINKLYIKLILNSDYFLKYAENKATGTTIKNVSLKAMQDFLIPLPPLAEQQRIVTKVEELMQIADTLKL